LPCCDFFRTVTVSFLDATSSSPTTITLGTQPASVSAGQKLLNELRPICSNRFKSYHSEIRSDTL
jgi:hypothetical protein